MYKKRTSLFILFFFLFSFIPLNSVKVFAGTLGPTGLTSVPVNQYSGSYVSLSWTAITGATSYNVYRSEDGGTTYTKIASPTVINYKDTTAVINTAYTYQVSAVVSSDETNKSSAVTAKVNTPIYKFDIGQNNVEPGYILIGNGYGVVATTIYSDQTGYGLTVATTGRDRGDYSATSPANAVYRDYAFVDNNSFKVKLPVGTYSVNFICGSTNTDSGATTNVSVNGTQIFTTAYGKGVVNEGYAVVTVTNTDPLELKFTGTNSKLNGLIITPLTSGPTNFKVDSVNIDTTPAHIDLSWTAAQEVLGYNIYRKALGDAAYTNVGTTTDASYQDKSFTIGKTYSYYVAATGVNGEAPSPVVDNVKAINTAVAVPAAPAGLASSRQPNSATVTWTKDDSVLFYNIYRKASSESDNKIIANVNAGTYTDSGLVGNMNYTYQISAVNAGGESDKASVEANAIIPTVPTPVVVEKAGWSVVDLLSTATDDAIGCKVYRSESIDGTYTLLGNATQGLNTFTSNVSAFRYKDTGLVANKDYYYQFTSYNYTGESQATSPIKVTTKNVIAKPDKPESTTLTSITKSGTSYTVRVEWTYSYGAASYNVYRSTNPNSGFTKIGTSTSGVYLDTIANGVENTPYYYKVSAVNVSGESDASSVLGAKITSNFRIKPIGITATSQMPTAEAINLDWTAVTGADSYNIYRSLKGDNNYRKIGNSATNSFVDSTGVVGSAYDYRVSSVDNINGESLKTFALKVDWAAIQGVSSYTVQRKLKWALDSTYINVGTSTNNSYLDDTAVAGVEYEYRIVDASNVVLNHEFYNKTANEMDDTNATMDVKIWLPSASFIDSNISVIKDTVKGLSYSYGGDTFKLNWQQVADATSYNVYKSTVKDSGYHLIGNIKTNEFVYADNDEAGTFYYKVTALNAGGESEKSEALNVKPKITLKRQMEKIDRGLLAVKTDEGVLVSWRYLATDSPNISFNVYRDGVKLNSQPITSSTNYMDAAGTTASKYYVCAVLDNKVIETTQTVTTWASSTKDIPLKKPAPGTTPDGKAYAYYPNDATVADLDGDGQYEIVLKWQALTFDNSQGGYTNNTLIDAYELDGTFMWRIDLGKNIRAGGHYTDIIAYDFDGDGKAEIALKTADGTVDGQGNIIGDEDKDYRNTGGYILDGPEYDTVFEGATGKALATVPYEPQRGLVADWGDAYGNRVDRFIAAVAYIDGKTPYFIEQRGYYSRMAISAYSYKDGKITKQWHFDTNIDDVDPSGLPYNAYQSQGNHQMEIADVDGDGKDEIITGASCIDNNGKALYTTGIGHGDAMHLGDLDPTRPGLELFSVHEDSNQKYGQEMRDALTGQILWGYRSGTDTGRGLTADIDPNYPGEEAWSGAPGANTSTGVSENGGVFTVKGERISDSNPSVNFAIWWDGDLSRELLDQNWMGYTGIPSPGRIDKWDYVNKTLVNLVTASGTVTGNGSKGNPAIQADIYGDWREEVLWSKDDGTALRLFVTPYETNNRIYTLMQDPVYRLGIAWQNTGYNQPPHTSFFLGNGMKTPAQPNITMQAGGEEVINKYNVLENIKVKIDKSLLKAEEKVKLTVNGTMTDGSQASFNETDIVYYSSNEAVASVSKDGVVTAVGDGVANIEITAIINGTARKDQLTITVDCTAPTTTWNLTGIQRDNGTFKSDVLLTLTASDTPTGSGVDKIEYSFDGTNWLTYNSSIEVKIDGISTINVRAYDIAGNIETAQNIKISIDKTPDILTSDLIKNINSMKLDNGTEKSLTAKLNNVINSILKGDKNNSVNQLNAFINEVNAQKGKKVTTEQASGMIQSVNSIIEKINSTTTLEVPAKPVLTDDK